MGPGSGDFSIGGHLWPGLSKLIEEAGEVQQVCGKIMGAWGAQRHWDGTNLPTRLNEEMADLQAAINFVRERCGLDVGMFETQYRKKINQFQEWHETTLANQPDDKDLPAGQKILNEINSLRELLIKSATQVEKTETVWKDITTDEIHGVCAVLGISFNSWASYLRKNSDLYRHKKGGIYRILQRGCMTDDVRTPVVIYEHIWPHEQGVWVRPAVEFDQFDRFRRIT